jgi:hypothetical protein
MNVRNAAWHLARRFPHGIEGAALAVGKNADTLRKELTGVHGYKLGIDDCDALTQKAVAEKVADPLAIVTTMAGNAGALVMLLPQQLDQGGGTFKCLAEAAREFSEFMASVADAQGDGEITANELRKVEREFGELVAKGQQCVARLQAMHEAGVPSHLREVRRA